MANYPEQQPRPTETEGRENPVFLPENVSLKMILSRHINGEDVGDFYEFRRKLKSADIFLPESIGWTDESLELFRAVSRGEKAAHRQALQTIDNPQNIFLPSIDFQRALLKALYASNRLVVATDLKAGDPLIDKGLIILTGKELYSTDFETALELVTSHVRKVALGTEARENHILRKIGPALTAAIESKPKLKEKVQVDVLMTLGAMHIHVADVLTRQANLQREARCSRLPVVEVELNEFDEPTSDLIQHFHPSLDHTLSDEQVKNATGFVLAMDMIDRTYASLDQFTASGQGVDSKTRNELEKLARSMSMDETKELFGAIRDLQTENAGLIDVLRSNKAFSKLVFSLTQLDNQRNPRTEKK